jgi:hypothetical protein
MLMRILSAAGAMLLGCLLWAHSASAYTVTTVIDFTATDFISSSGNVPAPVPTVAGSFTLTFDPTSNYWDESAGVLLNGININVSGTPLFSHFPGLFNGVTIGMSPAGANGAQWSTNDFFLAFSLTNNSYPFSVLFGYTQAGINNFFSTYNVKLTLSPPVTQTPIPGSALMLLTGLGAMGGVGFFRKRNAAAGAELVSA